jgi:enterochelin esterase-like enzyme
MLLGLVLAGPIEAGSFDALRARLPAEGTARDVDVAAFVESAGGTAARRMMTSELVPRVAREFPVEARADRRLVAGGSRGGMAAIDLALARPDVFGLCGAWAPAVAPKSVADLLEGRRAPGSRFFLIEALYDPAWGPDAPALREGLRTLDAEARLVQIPEGHTLATWRGVIDDVLEAFFPGPARPLGVVR